ncbi:uncharacterized protein TNCV_585941 [Trichonephila clavipes]|nr:uncharacterized protein TNCV_585941 [Trichonephila clavipes]
MLETLFGDLVTIWMLLGIAGYICNITNYDASGFFEKALMKVFSGYLPFRTNVSTLPTTPKRSSSRNVGTSSYRYHIATHTPLPVFRRIGERTIPYSWRACKQSRHLVGCVIRA